MTRWGLVRPESQCGCVDCLLFRQGPLPESSLTPVRTHTSPYWGSDQRNARSAAFEAGIRHCGEQGRQGIDREGRQGADWRGKKGRQLGREDKARISAGCLSSLCIPSKVEVGGALDPHLVPVLRPEYLHGRKPVGKHIAGWG